MCVRAPENEYVVLQKVETHVEWNGAVGAQVREVFRDCAVRVDCLLISRERAERLEALQAVQLNLRGVRVAYSRKTRPVRLWRVLVARESSE